jgi:hypothetical protein
MSDERGGVVYGTAGGPYCGVCGAPAEHEPLYFADGPGFTTAPGILRCPNRCDPRDVSRGSSPRTML